MFCLVEYSDRTENIVRLIDRWQNAKEPETHKHTTIPSPTSPPLSVYALSMLT